MDHAVQGLVCTPSLIVSWRICSFDLSAGVSALSSDSSREQLLNTHYSKEQGSKSQKIQSTLKASVSKSTLGRPGGYIIESTCLAK
jgi:hypothetical protein